MKLGPKVVYKYMIIIIITFCQNSCMRCSWSEMYIGFSGDRQTEQTHSWPWAVCVLSVPHWISTPLHGPGCNLGNARGCPLVVHYWADLQSVHGFRCYDNSAERKMSASACTRSVPGCYYYNTEKIAENVHWWNGHTFCTAVNRSRKLEKLRI